MFSEPVECGVGTFWLQKGKRARVGCDYSRAAMSLPRWLVIPRWLVTLGVTFVSLTQLHSWPL